MNKVAVIIVNWNGWKDTCECITSFGELPATMHIYIIDNNSDDDSLFHIKSFLINEKYSFEVINPNQLSRTQNSPKQICVISNFENSGFARANNLVLKSIHLSQNYEYAWLLNNDTVIGPNTLSSLLNTASRYKNHAFFGSVILDYYKKDKVQCCAVQHYPYLGISRLQFKGESWSLIKNKICISEGNLNYQMGAALFIRLKFLNQIGYLDEEYFMYSEEADWQIRAARNGFPNMLCSDSTLYHKGSVSTQEKKYLFFYYYNRSAILLSRKLFGLIPSVTSSIFLILITFFRTQLNINSIKYGIKGILHGWNKNLKSSNIL